LDVSLHFKYRTTAACLAQDYRCLLFPMIWVVVPLVVSW